MLFYTASVLMNTLILQVIMPYVVEVTIKKLAGCQPMVERWAVLLRLQVLKNASLREATSASVGSEVLSEGERYVRVLYYYSLWSITIPDSVIQRLSHYLHYIRLQICEFSRYSNMLKKIILLLAVEIRPVCAEHEVFSIIFSREMRCSKEKETRSNSWI